MSDKTIGKTWIEISAKAIKNNLAEMKRRVGRETSLLAVVKANAYGHGLAETAKIAARTGAGWLGVDSVVEAELARRATPRIPILILGYTPTALAKKAVELGARITVYDKKTVDAIASAKKLARVHIKLETGTTRQGVGERELTELVKHIKARPKIVLEGLSTHYANIEDTTDHAYAKRQLEEFARLAAIAEKVLGRPIPVKHTACSAAAILFPQTYFGLARVGIATYGLWPSRETQISARERNIKIDLRPALVWKSLIAQVKTVPRGTPVSYGLTARVTRVSRIAVIPVGYYDGFDRGLSSTGAVLVRGRRAPVLGRVCMNMFVIDVTDIPGVKAEDEVVLLGVQGRERISAEEIAAKIGTINYEVVSRINSLIPRIYI